MLFTNRIGDIIMMPFISNYFEDKLGLVADVTLLYERVSDIYIYTFGLIFLLRLLIILDTILTRHLE